MINAQLGITLDNMPEALFPMMTGDVGACDDGGPKINIKDSDLDSAVRLINESLMAHTGRCSTSVRIGTGILQLNPQADNNTALGINMNNAQNAQVEGVTGFGNTVTNNEEDDDNLEEDTTEDDDDGEDRLVEGPHEVIVHQHLEGERVTTMVAASLDNEISNSARSLSDRVDALQIKWTALLNESRKIQEATLLLEANPIINNIIRQSNEIREAANFIREVFYIDGHVVFVTDELVTDNVIDGHRRKIGRMEIQLSLKALVSQNSSTPRPVIIRNLDRRFVEGNANFQCGHVKGNGGICWGNAMEPLYHSIRDRDLDAVLDVIIRFIKNPNIADAYGRHMKYWPSAD